MADIDIDVDVDLGIGIGIDSRSTKSPPPPQPQAGPSSPRSSPPLPPAISVPPVKGEPRMSAPTTVPEDAGADVDVEMEDASGPVASDSLEVAAPPVGPASQEAAELLLSFSVPEQRPDRPEPDVSDQPNVSDAKSVELPSAFEADVDAGVSGNANASGTFPYTPPDEPEHRDESTALPEPIPSALESSSLSHLAGPSTSEASSTPLRFESPAKMSPETATAAPMTATASASASASAKQPKTKRKRNAVAGPSRRTSNDQPPAGVDSLDASLPPHYLGKDNEVIRCICGIEEDTGTSVQCERCYAWAHAQCWGFQDEQQVLPDVWLCELCEPRPHDATAAKRLQLALLSEMEQKRADLQAQGLRSDDVSTEKEKTAAAGAAAKSRGKPKRPRLGSATAAEGEGDRDTKDPSPGIMGPPAAKPKRRQPGPKPRSQKTGGTVESTPVPTFVDPPPPVDMEDDYFRIEPWALEYTPIKENLVRGAEARRSMCAVYREWVDAEEEIDLSKRRSVSGPSGLPSPTETGVMRLSPDNLFPSPDFSILAPPVPPVFIVGSDLGALGSPTSIRAIDHTTSFLPLTYAELGPSGIYTRPALYGVYADEPVACGAFIGEYRGEVIDCASYRKDPINQYAGLGMPKPHVRSIGPPVNLLIDSRGYGNTLRFLRSGCHPNVVLRPLFWRSADGETPKLKFGVFASKDIAKKDELVLAWEWDDQHVVHSLRSIVHATVLSDGSLGSPVFAVPDDMARSLADKFDATLTHLLGTFSACACVDPAGCALAQMRNIVETRDADRERGRPEAKRRGSRVRADLGELVGAVRGWRRREVEVEQVRKWQLPEGYEMLGRDRRSVSGGGSASASASGSGTGSVSVHHPPEESQDEEEVEVRSADVEEEGEDESMDVDVDEDVRSSIRASSPEHVVPPISASPRRTTKSSTTLAGHPSMREQEHGEPDLFVSSSSLSAVPSIRPSEPDLEEDEGSLSDATTVTLPRSQSSRSVSGSGSEGEEEQDLVAEQDDDARAVSEVKAKKAVGLTGGKRRRVLSPVAEASNLPIPLERKKVGKKAQAKTSGQDVPGRGERSPISKAKKPQARIQAQPQSQVLAKKGKSGPLRRQKNRVVSSPISDDEKMDLDEADAPVTADVKSPLARVRSRSPTNPVATMSDASDIKTSLPDSAPAEDERPLTLLDDDVTPKAKEATPPPAPREPTPPPPVPARKVTLSEYLRNHKIRKETAPASTEVVPLTTTATTGTGDDSGAADVEEAPTASATTTGPSGITIKSEPEPASAIAVANSGAVAGASAAIAPSRPNLNLYDHLPSRTPGTPAQAQSTPTYGLPLQTDSPRPFATPSAATATPGPTSASYVPRTDYFPPQSQSGTGIGAGSGTGAPLPQPTFPPRLSSSYTPRTPSTSAHGEGDLIVTTPLGSGTPSQPRRTSVSTTDYDGVGVGISHGPPPPRNPNLDEHLPSTSTPSAGGFGSGSGAGSRANTIISPTRPPYVQPSVSPTSHTSALPPVLPTRDLPPHQAMPPQSQMSTSPSHALAGPSTSPIHTTGANGSIPNGPMPTSGLPNGASGPAGPGTGLPRAPPTGPKVPPTGPRGSWGNNAIAAHPPPSGPRGPGGPGGPSGPGMSMGMGMGMGMGGGVGGGPGGGVGGGGFGGRGGFAGRGGMGYEGGRGFFRGRGFRGRGRGG